MHVNYTYKRLATNELLFPLSFQQLHTSPVCGSPKWECQMKYLTVANSSNQPPHTTTIAVEVNNAKNWMRSKLNLLSLTLSHSRSIYMYSSTMAYTVQQSFWLTHELIEWRLFGKCHKYLIDSSILLDEFSESFVYNPILWKCHAMHTHRTCTNIHSHSIQQQATHVQIRYTLWIRFKFATFGERCGSLRACSCWFGCSHCSIRWRCFMLY